MTTTTPSTELETELSKLRSLANDIDDSAGWAIKTEAGSTSRDRHCAETFASLEELELQIQAVRTAMEALP